jgi:hypothetical protein
MRKPLLSISAVAAALARCGMIAVATAPEKSASVTRTGQATEADAQFWDRFHAGDYAAIPRVHEALQAAYLRDPGDVKTAAHIGWLHIWKLSERARLAAVPASITDEASLARKYFAESKRLDPADARLAGFYASATLAEALGWQWENIDVCIGARIDRSNPDYKAYLHLATTTGPNRVCWNGTIAPHNFEGFFLNMGDMLVKSGDWRTAQILYRNAKLSPTFAAWPFTQVLEQRIVAAESNVAAFNASPGDGNAPAGDGNAPAGGGNDASGEGGAPADGASGDRRVMIETRFSCMGCHQARPQARSQT